MTLEPVSFTVPGSGIECPACDSLNVEDVEEDVEDTDGRCYVRRGSVCIDCGHTW